jgi:uncharacterized protein RhaS with RHS repeats
MPRRCSAQAVQAQNTNVAFSYDAAGALVKKGDNHLHYGADGRIAKAGEYADAADARAVSYVYNALGQRVLKSDSFDACTVSFS